MNRKVGETLPNGGTYAYEYDENGNLSSQVSPMGNTMRYSYDKLDRLEETLDPAGRKESYTYDSVGNLTKKTVNDTRVTSYVYDANGNLTSLTNVLGQTETKKYDNMNRRERVCQDDFCKFSKFKYLSAEKSPNISCLHIS